MLNFLKNLFSIKPSTPSFGMGSLPSPADSRNISLTQVQAPVEIPSAYMTDISMLGVENQGNAPICVGESMVKIAQYYIYKRTGTIVKFDPQIIYDQCKKEDGVPEQAGTFANVAAKIIVRDGIDQIGLDSNDKIATGYAFVPTDFQSLCQAIYQNGIMTIGLAIDSNWFLGIIGHALQYIGGHQTDLHGYDIATGRLYGINSWGINWIGQIAGSIDSNVKQGFYVAQYDDIKDSILNAIVLAAIPKAVIDDVKATPYRFVTTMKYGSSGYEVTKLQQALGVTPQDGSFGSKTRSAVISYQTAHGLAPDGIVGPAMRAKLNSGTKSFIPQWMDAITAMEGAKPSRNNPGNLRFIGQQYAVNDGGFCKFDTLAHGKTALENLLVNACSGNSSNYKPDETLYEFYAGLTNPNRFGKNIDGYAPYKDGNDPKKYSNFVATRLGVPVTIRIGDLL